MTTEEKEQLIDYLRKNMKMTQEATFSPISNDPTGIRTIVGVMDVFEAIRNFEFEPTEGSTEDTKEPECCCQPDYKAMYEKEAEQNAVLQHMNGMLERSLDRARASLRTFEFIYGRKLDGIS